MPQPRCASLERELRRTAENGSEETVGLEGRFISPAATMALHLLDAHADAFGLCRRKEVGNDFVKWTKPPEMRNRQAFGQSSGVLISTRLSRPPR